MFVFPRRLALVAAGWSMLVALLHAAWALAGVGAGTPTVLNALALVLCVACSGVALTLADGTASPVVRAAAWSAAALLPVAGLAIVLAGGRPEVMLAVFLLGAVLFGATAHATPRIGPLRFA